MKPAKRFTHYCLDEGEEYFDDAIAEYYAPVEGQSVALSERKTSKGRLRICSNSLFFEPDDTKSPIIKFPLKNIQERSVPQIPSCNEDEERHMFYFRCPNVLHMMQNFRVVPYTHVAAPGQHIFSLTFSNLEAFLDRLNNFLCLSRLPYAARKGALSQLMSQHDKEHGFDYSWLNDAMEVTQYEHLACRVIPLVRVRGRVLVTDKTLYFQAFNNIDALPVVRIPLKSIERVESRRYMLREIALEIQTKNDTVLYIAFESGEHTERNRLYHALMNAPGALSGRVHDSKNMWTEWWRQGRISTFDYLMHLNSLAGRSFNDLSQYPVFPWVLSDYQSTSLDLQDRNVYRNLSRPIGALNASRLEYFKARMAEMEQTSADISPIVLTKKKSLFANLFQRSQSQPEPEKRPQAPRDDPFLYGTHYSTPGYVLFYLVRQVPEYMLLLHQGKFDAPDRLFDSIGDCWASVSKVNTDLKELIPEFFFGNGDFLHNSRGYELGLGEKQDGRSVKEHVQLPPWANGDPKEFIRINRLALESDYVSENIHHWIDLIFGCNQRGEAAREHDNLFHPMTYEAGIDLENVADDLQRQALELQIREFGQTPAQLFVDPHPPRLVKRTPEEHISHTSYHLYLNDSSESNEPAPRRSLGARNAPLIIASKMVDSVIKDSFTRNHSMLPSNDSYLSPTHSFAKSPSPVLKNSPPQRRGSSEGSGSHIQKINTGSFSIESSNDSGEGMDAWIDDSPRNKGRKNGGPKKKPMRPMKPQWSSGESSPFDSWEETNSASKQKDPASPLDAWADTESALNKLGSTEIPPIQDLSVSSFDPSPMAEDITLSVSMDGEVARGSILSATLAGVQCDSVCRVHKGEVMACIVAPLSSGTLSWISESYPDQANALISHSVSKDGTVKIFNLTSNEQIRSFNNIGTAPIRSLAITAGVHPNLLLGGLDSNIYVFKTVSGKVGDEIHAHDTCITAAALSPNGHLFVSVSNDATIKFWKTTEEGSLNACAMAEIDVEEVMLCVAIDPLSRKVVCGDTCGTVNLYELGDDMMPTHCATETFAAHSNAKVVSVAWLNDEHFVTGCSEGAIKVFNTAEPQLPKLNILTKPLVAIAVDARVGKRRIYAVCKTTDDNSPGVVNVYDASNGHKIQDLVADSIVGPLSSIAVSADGKAVIAGAEDGNIVVWNVK